MTLSRFLDNPGIQHYPRNETEWRHWINEVAKWIADQDIVTANTAAAASAAADAAAAAEDAVNAGLTSIYAIASPASYVWRTDPAGVYPAGDPEFDITTTFYNASDTQVGQQVLRGSLSSALGLIGVTDPGTSAPPLSGYSVAFTVINQTSDSVRADITITMPNLSTMTVSVSWSAMDISTAGGTPATGGGK